MDPNQAPEQPTPQPTPPVTPVAVNDVAAPPPEVTAPLPEAAPQPVAEPTAAPAVAVVSDQPPAQEAPVPSDAFGPAPVDTVAPAASVEENPSKSYIATFVISFLVGGLGIDRYYLKKYGTGILKFLTLGGLGVWATVDFLLIAFGKLKAKGDDRPLKGYAENHHGFKIAAVILTVLSVVLVVVLTIALLAASQEQSFVDQY